MAKKTSGGAAVSGVKTSTVPPAPRIVKQGVVQPTPEPILESVPSNSVESTSVTSEEKMETENVQSDSPVAAPVVLRFLKMGKNKAIYAVEGMPKARVQFRGPFFEGDATPSFTLPGDGVLPRAAGAAARVAGVPRTKQTKEEREAALKVAREAWAKLSPAQKLQVQLDKTQARIAKANERAAKLSARAAKLSPATPAESTDQAAS